MSDAGTPTVSDPGGQLIAAAIAAGIRVEPIPGPSALLAALAASGMPYDAFMFMGFPPTRAKEREAWFARAREIGGTLVFFEAPHRIERTLADLKQFAGDCQVTVGRELTKAHEELVRGPISDVLSAGFKGRGEFTVVANIGLMPEYTPIAVASDDELALEFGELTHNIALTRRQAIAQVARRHRLAPNVVYAALERARKSVNRPT